MARQKKADNIPGLLYFTATQGGANAFVQATIATGITPQSGYGLLVREIQFEISDWLGQNAGANRAMVQFTKDSQAAELFLDDDGVYAKWVMEAQGETTTIPDYWLQFPVVLSPKRDLLIVTENLYVGFDTNNWFAAETIYGRILYDTVTVSELDALRIIQG